MRTCKNDRTRTYKGTEPSPLGNGYSAAAEPAGKVRVGADGGRWRAAGSAWRRQAGGASAGLGASSREAAAPRRRVSADMVPPRLPRASPARASLTLARRPPHAMRPAERASEPSAAVATLLPPRASPARASLTLARRPPHARRPAERASEPSASVATLLPPRAELPLCVTEDDVAAAIGSIGDAAKSGSACARNVAAVAVMTLLKVAAGREPAAGASGSLERLSALAGLALASIDTYRPFKETDTWPDALEGAAKQVATHCFGARADRLEAASIVLGGVARGV